MTTQALRNALAFMNPVTNNAYANQPTPTQMGIGHHSYHSILNDRGYIRGESTRLSSDSSRFIENSLQDLFPNEPNTKPKRKVPQHPRKPFNRLTNNNL